MSPVKNTILKNHFDQLKSIVTEVYQDGLISGNTKADALYELLKNSLRVIEAMYVQNPDLFSQTKAETYSGIVTQLHKMGMTYEPNASILSRANHTIPSPSKKPMERVHLGRIKPSNRRAG